MAPRAKAILLLHTIGKGKERMCDARHATKDMNIVGKCAAETRLFHQTGAMVGEQSGTKGSDWRRQVVDVCWDTDVYPL
jgi:hypothetical protein